MIFRSLLADVPDQPSEEQLKANPFLPRFTMIFDREGYSPDFFREMCEHRIASQTYNKYPGDDWPAEEFAEVRVAMPYGQVVTMPLRGGADSRLNRPSA